MSSKELIYWREAEWNTRDQERLLDMLAVACDRMSWRFLVLSGGHPSTIAMLRQASNALIWNGTTPGAKFVVDMRKRLGMPTLTIEQGWLPQTDFFGLDYTGVAGNSSLCNDDLSWVGDPEHALLEDLRRTYAPEDWKPPRASNARTLVVGQLMSDSQVVGFTQYQTFNEFIADSIDQLGTDQITVRPHPLSDDQDEVLQLCRVRGLEVSDPKEEDFVSALSKHGSVYGITSTALLEASLLDVSAMACGECPLLSHQGSRRRVEDLLAALAYRQIPKECDDIIPYLDSMEEFEFYPGN